MKTSKSKVEHPPSFNRTRYNLSSTILMKEEN